MKTVSVVDVFCAQLLSELSFHLRVEDAIPTTKSNVASYELKEYTVLEANC